jgi:A/G-specific adenine glycosylase
VAAGCRARAAGTVAERPLRRRRQAVPTRTWGVLVAVSPRGRTLVVRRPPEGLLGGMWEFPPVEVEDGADARTRVVRLAGGSSDPRTAARAAEPGAGAVVDLPPITHRFSHFTAVYRPCLVEVAGQWEEAGGRWVTPSELADLPLPVAQQRIAQVAGL